MRCGEIPNTGVYPFFVGIICCLAKRTQCGKRLCENHIQIQYNQKLDPTKQDKVLSPFKITEDTDEPEESDLDVTNALSAYNKKKEDGAETTNSQITQDQ